MQLVSRLDIEKIVDSEINYYNNVVIKFADKAITPAEAFKHIYPDEYRAIVDERALKSFGLEYTDDKENFVRLFEGEKV